MNTQTIEHKLMEVQLQALTLELKRSNNDLISFAHTAAHELKQPVYNIIGFIRILEDIHKGRLEPASAHAIFQIVCSAKRMSTIVDNLLMYAMVGSSGLNMQLISVEEALQTALENLHEIVGDSDAVIIHDPLPTLLCDNTQIICLLQNLIDNAIKFCGNKPPRIEILAKECGTELIFSVCDNGIGIDPKYYGKIFDIFERLNPQSEYPNTGMGLAICKRIVERHKGRIWVESRLGEGTTFYFTLAERMDQ